MGAPNFSAWGQFMAPSELRNPSGETLNTDGLQAQRYINYLFYGRFDRMRAEDVGRGRFSWLYYHLIRIYGGASELLAPPLVELEITLENRGTGFYDVRKFIMEQKVVASFKRNEEDRVGLFNSLNEDIEALFLRHAPNSPAMIQLYENFYRYANDLLPVQDTPDEWRNILEFKLKRNRR